MPTEQKKSGKGCLFYGCLTFVVLALVVVVGGTLGVRYVFGNLAEQLTMTSPVVLPSSEMSDEDYAALEQRIGEFNQALEDGRGYELVLDADDVNALIARHPELGELKGNAFIGIDDGRIKSEVSFPTSRFAELPFVGWFLSKFKDRYFNGSLEIVASLENDRLDVRIVSASLEEEAVPDDALARISRQNWAEQYNANPESRAQIEKLESIKVEDDTIIIRVRERSANTEPEPTEAPAEPANDAL